MDVKGRRSKYTEVGVIPEDWDVRRLGDLGKVVRGGSPRPAGDRRYFNGNYIPWLTVAALTNIPDHQLLVGETVSFLTEEGSKLSRTLPEETLIIANSGATLGVAKVLSVTCCANDGIAAILDQQLGDKSFVCLCINSRTRHLREVVATGNGQPNLNTTLIRSIPIPFPPIPEQRAISNTLSDVAALLDGLERLITKKRDLMQATRQQLLTGQTRLPRFHGEWKMRSLGTLGHWTGGMTPAMQNPAFWDGGDFPWISSGDVKASRLMDTSQHVTSWAVRNRATTVVPAKSIALVTRSGILRKYLPVALVMRPMAINQDIKALIPDTTVSAEFLLHALTRCGDAILAKCLKTGTTVESVEFRWLKAFNVSVPPHDEQLAIAAILSDMDAELTALEAQRDKIRTLKQGMMQELLTGRTRLLGAGATERREVHRTTTPSANIHFKRSVLAAEIIDRLHEEPTFGHVKFEKLIFLVEHLCSVDTGSAYHRDAAGPYDNRALRSIDSQLRKQKWFDARKIGDRYRYEPMANRGKHKEYFERYFAGMSSSFDTIIDTFRTFTTERCEIVATLLGAWNELIQAKAAISDDVIVNEVLNNWHESKKRIPEDRWRKALAWMRDKGFIPRAELEAR